jgi:hypothetical protein
MLLPSFRFDFTTNPDCNSPDAMRTMMAGGGTAYWKGIKGLWTKDFTYRPDDND